MKDTIYGSCVVHVSIYTHTPAILSEGERNNNCHVVFSLVVLCFLCLSLAALAFTAS